MNENVFMPGKNRIQCEFIATAIAQLYSFENEKENIEHVRRIIEESKVSIMEIKAINYYKEVL